MERDRQPLEQALIRWKCQIPNQMRLIIDDQEIVTHEEALGKKQRHRSRPDITRIFIRPDVTWGEMLKG